MTTGLYDCFVKVEFAKEMGVGDQGFFLCWVNDIDSDTVWFDGSLAEFDSEVRSRLFELL